MSPYVDEVQLITNLMACIRQQPAQARALPTWSNLAARLSRVAHRREALRWAERLCPPTAEVQAWIAHLETAPREIPLEASDLVRCPVAGTQYYQPVVRRLRLGEAVVLHLEPYNPDDPYAVSVDTQAGQRIGYLPREDAHNLHPRLHAFGAPLIARVTHLSGDYPRPEPIKVQIAFCAPREEGEAPIQAGIRVLGYVDHNTVYLDCDQTTLKQIEAQIKDLDIEVEESRYTSRPAPDGWTYRYKIRYHGDYQHDLRELLTACGVQLVGLGHWAQQAEAENRQLRQRLADVEGECEALRRQVRRCEENLNAMREAAAAYAYTADTAEAVDEMEDERLSPAEWERTLEALFPKLSLLGDSAPCLRSMRRVWPEMLVALARLNNGERLEKVKDLHATKFMEYRKGDYRLYFRREKNGTIKVLIAHKKTQERDEEFLKRY